VTLSDNVDKLAVVMPETQISTSQQSTANNGFSKPDIKTAKKLSIPFPFIRVKKQLSKHKGTSVKI